MGSRLSITKKSAELAYIAGFLDGDGSLMLQIKKRSDSKLGWRFMVTICFYQDSRHDSTLSWIKKSLGIGYLSKRNDGITELRINGYQQCEEILRKLYPYIRFKKQQVDCLLRALKILKRTRPSTMPIVDRQVLLDCIIDMRNYNYNSSQSTSLARLKKILNLTP